MFTDIPETPVCRAFIPSSNMGGVIAVLISEEGGGKVLLTFHFRTLIPRTTGNRFISAKPTLQK